MTPDERQLVTHFLQDLNQVRGMAKDQEADGMIRQLLASNPDAAYWLIQHAIVADQSLHAAQARIAELEEQVRDLHYRTLPTPVQAAPASPSFLPPRSSPSGPWGQAAYTPQPTDYTPPPPQERPGLFSAQSGLGSFLRNAGTTAAGVASGEMLFSGLSDMFGRHNGGGGGLFGGGQGFVDQPEETIVNNYYDSGDDMGDGGDDDRDNY